MSFEADIAIRIEGLSKAFDTYAAPTDRLAKMAFSLGRRLAGDSSAGRWFGAQAQARSATFWALRDVSFGVRRGETTAILGRNGAGKSTLLQIIAGTLQPTAGSADVHGKVAAILELGAGFNPDYTGRDNVRINGQLLGLSIAEIEAQMDAIAAFADIDRFFDLPVKTYSTGMHARLAFAISTCVNPDVLIVDEALAVGDIGFQFKCFQRLRELKTRGVSILLVTHSMSSVLDHADHAVLLDHGRLLAASHHVKEVVTEYEKVIRGIRPTATAVLRDETAAATDHAQAMTQAQLAELAARTRNAEVHESRFGSARAIVEEVVVTQSLADGADAPLLEAGDATLARFRIQAGERIRDVVLGVSIRKADGADLWGDNNLYARAPITLEPGLNTVEYEFDLNLAAGEYLLFVGLASLESGAREELDQRWPVRRLVVASAREQVGAVYAPVRVRQY